MSLSSGSVAGITSPSASARPSAPNARVLYNGQVAKLTGWGFAVIGLPMLIFLFITLRRMITQLSRLTGLKEEEIMLPR